MKMLFAAAVLVIGALLAGCGGSDDTPRWNTADFIQTYKDATGCTLRVGWSSSGLTQFEGDPCGFPDSNVYISTQAVTADEEIKQVGLVDVGDGKYVGAYEAGNNCRSVTTKVNPDLLAWSLVCDPNQDPNNYGSLDAWAESLRNVFGSE
jgi:hypothetical protein